MIDARALLCSLADALETDPALAVRLRSALGSSETAGRYHTRRTSPLEARAWDRMIASGEVPTFKPGREILVRTDDLHTWIERNGETTAGEAVNEVSEFEAFAARVRRKAAQ